MTTSYPQVTWAHITLPGWKVDPDFALPEGFGLREDEDLVYLTFGPVVAAIFSKAVAKEHILHAAAAKPENG